MKTVAVRKINVNFNNGGDSEVFYQSNIKDVIDGEDVETELKNAKLDLYEKVLDFLEAVSVEDEYGEINDQLYNAATYGFSLIVEVDGKKFYIEPSLIKGRRNQIILDDIDFVDEY